MIPFNGFKIGKIFGIEIEINYTWFIIFLLVSFALSYTYFPSVYPQLSLYATIPMGLFTSMLFFGSVLFHEFMHSIVALRNGLSVQKITLFVFGGVSQIEEEPKTPAMEFKMAIVGPGSSLFLSLLFSLGASGLISIGTTPVIFGPFIWLGVVNLLLAVFNMIPGFPLDGGRVLRSILWAVFKNVQKATKIASTIGQGFAFLIIITGIAFLFSGLLDGLWLAFIGWFLNNAAVATYRQIELKELLKKYLVNDLMEKDIETMPSNTRLDKAVDSFFLRSDKALYPVVKGGSSELVGVVRINDVQSVPQNEWQSKKVENISKTLNDDIKINPKDTAMIALQKMSKANKNNLFVVSNKKLQGKISKDDIARVVRLKKDTNNSEAA